MENAIISTNDFTLLPQNLNVKMETKLRQHIFSDIEIENTKPNRAKWSLTPSYFISPSQNIVLNFFLLKTPKQG